MEKQYAVFYYGREFGLDYSTIGWSYEGCVREALGCEDKYAPARVVMVDVLLYPDFTAPLYYRGELHTEEEALRDGMLD